MWTLLACHEPEPPPPTVDVFEGEAVTCEAPEARAAARFDRSTEARWRADVAWNWGGGAIVADLDGDDRVEVVSPIQPGLLLYRDRGEGLQPEPIETLQAFGLDFATGGAAGDYDGDGDLDLYVARSRSHPVAEGSDGRNHLLRNRGDGTFDDVTDEAGVDGCSASGECWATTTAAWGDVDGDGWLDLYVGNYGLVDETDGTRQEDMEPGDPDVLYRNRGDGTFEDVSAEHLSAAFQQGYTYAGGLLDLDDDGDLDLYSVNDFGNLYPNQVAWNDGGHLATRSPETSGLSLSMTGMGMAVAELTGDGRPDLAIPQWRHNTLLESTGSLWLDAAGAREFLGDEASGQHVGWGAQFGDLDLDGAEELVVAYGFLESDNSIWDNARRQPDAVYHRESDGDAWIFADQGPDYGLDDLGSGRSVSMFDWNHDGWLDVWTRNLDSADVLSTARCGEGHWIELLPRQPGTPNVFAVGAKLEVEAGGVVHTRWVTAGGVGFATSLPPEVHVGLGDATRVDRVSIRWPDGTWDHVDDLAVDRRTTLERRLSGP